MHCDNSTENSEVDTRINTSFCMNNYKGFLLVIDSKSTSDFFAVAFNALLRPGYFVTVHNSAQRDCSSSKNLDSFNTNSNIRPYCFFGK